MQTQANTQATYDCDWCGLRIEWSERYGAWRVVNAGGPATFCHPSPIGMHVADDCAICVPGQCPGPGECVGNYGTGDEAPPVCILTGEPGENPDDCTTHEHENSGQS